MPPALSRFAWRLPYRTYVLFSMFLLCWSYSAKAQVVDSLTQVLDQPDLPRSEKIQTLYLLSRELTYVDNFKALEYAEAALALSMEEKDTEGIAYAHRILGSIYAINGDYFSSMQFLHKALDIFTDRGDTTGIANCYISLGHVYRMLENRELEVGFHKKSYELIRKTDKAERIGVTAHNLGESYLNAGDIPKAEEFTRMAIRINDSLQNLPVLSNCYKVMGLIQLAQNKRDIAQQYFLDALEIGKQLGDKAQKVASVESLIRLAEISQTDGDPNKERSYLQRAVNLGQKYNLNEYLSEAYYHLALFHARHKELELAQDYMALQKTHWEEMRRSQLRDRAQLTEGMLNIERLSQEAAALQKVTVQQERSLSTRNRTLILIGACLLILSLFLYKLLKLNRQLRTNNRIIEKQREELASLNATKDKFFSIVAHDIRSPLDALKSFTTLLLEHYETMSRDEVQQMGAHLDRSVDNTLQLANNLIVWAKGQMNEIATEQSEFELRPVLENIHSVFEVIAGQKNIALKISCPQDTVVWGDRNQIEFVIRNLVNNAVKYTRTGGHVKVAVENTAVGTIQITIADNGIGMEQEIVDRLFKIRTEKSRTGTAGEIGSGLGLALSHDFVMLNKGSIQVESQPDQGTSFTLILKEPRRAA